MHCVEFVQGHSSLLKKCREAVRFPSHIQRCERRSCERRKPHRRSGESSRPGRFRGSFWRFGCLVRAWCSEFKEAMQSLCVTPAREEQSANICQEIAWRQLERWVCLPHPPAICWISLQMIGLWKSRCLTSEESNRSFVEILWLEKERWSLRLSLDLVFRKGRWSSNVQQCQWGKSSLNTSSWNSSDQLDSVLLSFFQRLKLPAPVCKVSWFYRRDRVPAAGA